MVKQKRILPDRPLTWKEHRTRWVAANPEKALEINRRAKSRRKDKVNEYKSARGCADCGITDHRVLDLHHRDDVEKLGEVSRLRTRRGWDAVFAEMEKCDVLCANCHRIRHHEERQREGADIQMTTGAFFRAS